VFNQTIAVTKKLSGVFITAFFVPLQTPQSKSLPGGCAGMNERTQWCTQPYFTPSRRGRNCCAGRYNRWRQAGHGFCTDEQYEEFFERCRSLKDAGELRDQLIKVLVFDF
jgi:hypothetical protein